MTNDQGQFSRPGVIDNLQHVLTFVAVFTDVVILWGRSVCDVNAVRGTQLLGGAGVHVSCYRLLFIPLQWHLCQCAGHRSALCWIRLRSVTTTNTTTNTTTSWWRSIVVRTSVLASELSLSCARLTDGCLTTLWVKCLLYQSTNKANSACHPSGVG